MSDQQHTPGPYMRISTHRGVEQVCCEGPEGGVIARLDTNKPPEVNRANAMLLSAAPDLLAALKDMTEIVRAAVEYDGATWCRERLARAEAAIAKAEGRQ